MNHNKFRYWFQCEQVGSENRYDTWRGSLNASNNEVLLIARRYFVISGDSAYWCVTVTPGISRISAVARYFGAPAVTGRLSE